VCSSDLVPVKLVSPEYCTVIECVPAVSVDTVKLACTVVVEMAAKLSGKATVPNAVAPS